MRQQFRTCLLTVITVMLLASCATNKQENMPSSAPTNWDNRQAILRNITNFTVNGRVAFLGTSQRISANFLWEQRGDSLTLRLTTFFGSTLLRLEASPGFVSITDDKGNRYSDSDAGRLLANLTGISLPVEEMKLWLRGLPSPKNSYTLTAQNDRIAQLKQFASPDINKSGWVVNYLTYDPATNGLLPEKIRMEESGQKVNLQISSWTFH